VQTSAEELHFFFVFVIKINFWVFCEGENVRHMCTYLNIKLVNHHNPSLTILTGVLFAIAL